MLADKLSKPVFNWWTVDECT